MNLPYNPVSYIPLFDSRPVGKNWSHLLPNGMGGKVCCLSYLCKACRVSCDEPEHLVNDEGDNHNVSSIVWSLGGPIDQMSEGRPSQNAAWFSNSTRGSGFWPGCSATVPPWDQCHSLSIASKSRWAMRGILRKHALEGGVGGCRSH